jgi:2,4-dienoyl-CoA reductase-like NADH-dependent reductase (Old Yellow Enzyme family)
MVPQPLWPATAFAAAAERGRRERIAVERYVVSLVHALIPRVFDAILDEIDLTEIVMDRVDLDAAVAAVDIDAIAGRLDFNAVVDRVPIDRVIDRVDIDSVADRIDLDRAIKRVDLDAVIAAADIDQVASRLDVEAVINRVDLVAIARKLLDELDLPEIIRQSTGTMASDTVRGVRMRSFEADQKVSRTVDRLRPHRRPINP